MPELTEAMRAKVDALPATTRELAIAEEGRGYSSLIPLDRSRGGGLIQAKSLDELPENLVRQLYDPSIALEQPLYLVTPTASNGNVDWYGTRMMPSSLRNYAADATNGLPFLYMHQPSQWLGRVYEGHYKQARSPAVARTEMDVYMPVGMNVNGVDTAQIVIAMRSGVARDVSITFDPDHGGSIICSLDGRHMARSFWEFLFSDPDDPDSCCAHMPGVEYEYEGSKQMAIGQVEDSHTIELSTVYRGATPSAQLPFRSRALVIEESMSGGLGDAVDSLTLRSAGWRAEMDRLGRSEALSIESRFRGVRFPSITDRLYAPMAGLSVQVTVTDPPPAAAATTATADEAGTAAGESAEQVQSAGGDSPSPPPSPPAAGHSTLDVSQEDVPTMPEPEDRASAQGAAEAAAAAATSGPGGEGVAAQANPSSPHTAQALDPLPRLRAALVQHGLAPEGFTGDADALITRFRELSTELTDLREWADVGKQARDVLVEDCKKAGVRAFGSAGLPEAAYGPLLSRGKYAELQSLKDHLEGIGAQRFKGGRATSEGTADTPVMPPTSLPDYAFRTT